MIEKFASIARKPRAFLLALALVGSAIGGGVAVADNAAIVVLPATARPASTTHYQSTAITNQNWRGVRLYMAPSAKTGSSTLDCKVQSKDEVAGTWADLVGAAFPQVSATAAPTPLVIYPGLTAVTNKVTNDVLPRVWRVDCLVAGTSFTFGVSGSLQQ